VSELAAIWYPTGAEDCGVTREQYFSAIWFIRDYDNMRREAQDLLDQSPIHDGQPRGTHTSDPTAEAAERTAQAYNDLVDAVENLSDQYDGLENLTRGTKEWKKAVKEVNAEVLDLIEKYPELAGFVENKNGVLTLDIESKEVQDVLEKYENKAAQASAASYAAKINVNEKKASVRANEVNSNKNLQGVYVSTGDSGYYQDLTQGTLKAVS
jgi:hypothetical protein